MNKFKKYFKLIVAILSFGASALCFIFPDYVTKYIALAAGIYMIVRGFIEWFYRFKDKNYSPLYMPLFRIIVGIIFILGWKFIINWILLIIGIVLIILTIIRLSTIPYYTSVGEKPLYPFISGFTYLIIGLPLTVTSIIDLYNDSCSKILGYIIGAGFIIYGLESLFNFITNNKIGPNEKVHFDHTPKNKEVIEANYTEHEVQDDSTNTENK